MTPRLAQADGKIHRCDVDGKSRSSDAAYLLHIDGVAARGFQNWQKGDWQHWCSSDAKFLTPEQREELRFRAEARIEIPQAGAQGGQMDVLGRARGCARNRLQRADRIAAHRRYLRSLRSSSQQRVWTVSPWNESLDLRCNAAFSPIIFEGIATAITMRFVHLPYVRIVEPSQVHEQRGWREREGMRSAAPHYRSNPRQPHREQIGRPE